jgi:hypothetical protein
MIDYRLAAPVGQFGKGFPASKSTFEPHRADCRA